MKPEFIRRGPKLTEARLTAIEKKYSIRLPKDYRDFMLEKNGGIPDPNSVCRKRSKTPSLDCRYLFSVDSEDFLEDWISRYEEMKGDDKDALPKQLIPIGIDSSNCVLCLSVSGNNSGKVYYFGESAGFKLLADSFAQFLSQFAEYPDENPEIKISEWVAIVKQHDQKKLATWLKNGGKWKECDVRIGRSPLELAIELDSWPTVKLLLRHKANLQQAFEHAVQVSRWNLVRTLQKYAKPRTLKPNAQVLKKTMESCNDVRIVKKMLDDGASISVAPFKQNLLYYATLFRNNPEIISLLIKRGAKLTQKAEGQNALANALCNGAFDAAKLLLDAGQKLYEAPKVPSKRERLWTAQIKEMESKPRANKRLLEMLYQNLEDEQQIREEQAPIYACFKPWKKLPPNFKKDVMAYAAKLGQNPP